jgi:DNA-directed RNA polymerase subunit H
MLGEDFNILNHELVPEHIILKEEEKKEVLEKFKIKPENLPKILLSDPVVKAINAKEGDILKIIRQSKTAGTSLYYRIVVKK